MELNCFTNDARANFQNLRNLGLAHTALAKLAGSEDAKLEMLKAALDDFQRAAKFLNRLPHARVRGELLEVMFRQGEALVALRRMQEAEKVLVGLCKERRADRDWHNEARSLDLLLKANNSCDALRAHIERVVEIYSDVFKDSEKMIVFRRDKYRPENAQTILSTAAAVAQTYAFSDLEESIAALCEQLRAQSPGAEKGTL
jgi:hypothetical protein